LNAAATETGTEDLLDEALSSAAASAASYLPSSGRAAAPSLRGGKGVRARFLLMLHRALGGEGAAGVPAAASVELVHLASLLHDDCVDGAATRRGAATVNAACGDKTAVLLGDLLLTEALLRAAVLPALSRERLIAAIRDMALGELEEESGRGALEVSRERWLRIASRKTGALFGWCGDAAARLAGRPGAAEALREAGLAAGTAFQIADDLVDFEPEQVTGKPRFQDLRAGRVGFPLLLALEAGCAGCRNRAAALFDTFAPHAAALLEQDLCAEGWLLEARREAERSAAAAARLIRAETGADLDSTLAALILPRHEPFR
jgi:geranylgeranyl pyrophosphate synthase